MGGSIYYLSTTRLFGAVALEAAGSQVHPFPQIKLLVRFKASGFWYLINTGPSLKLLSDIPLLPGDMGIWQSYGSAGPGPFLLQQVRDGPETEIWCTQAR